MINEEGGIDIEEFRYARSSTGENTTGTVWLGLTIGPRSAIHTSMIRSPRGDYYPPPRFSQQCRRAGHGRSPSPDLASPACRG